MRRYTRQLHAHRRIVARLRADPTLLEREDIFIRQRLAFIAAVVHGATYTNAVARWTVLLDSRNLDALASEVLADTDAGGYLRAVSPLGFLAPTTALPS